MIFYSVWINSLVYSIGRASWVAQLVKNLPAVQESLVWSLGWEDPVEESMATLSSILAWRIPMDRGAWWVTVHGVAESDTTERWSTHSPWLCFISHVCESITALLRTKQTLLGCRDHVLTVIVVVVSLVFGLHWTKLSKMIDYLEMNNLKLALM